MKISLALLGCGYWGKNYVKTLQNIKEAKLKYVYDINSPSIILPEDIIFTQDMDKILNDPQIKGVIIAIPTKYIHTVTKRCLESNKDILMEKPMTDSSNKALELINIARQKNLILMVGHVFIYHPAIIKLKEIMNSGELGEIKYIHSMRVAPGPVRNTDEINALWDLAPHDISIFHYLLGKEQKVVKAFASDFLRPSIIDSASFSLKYKDTFAEAHVRWLDAEKIRRITVIGSKKIAVYDELGQYKLKIFNLSVNFDKKPSIIDMGNFIPNLESVSPLEKQCKIFLDSIITRKEPITNGVSGYEVVRTLEAIEKTF